MPSCSLCHVPSEPQGHQQCRGVTEHLLWTPLLRARPGLPGSDVPAPLRGQPGFSRAVPDSPLIPGFSGLQVRSLEAHMYPEKLKVIAQQVQLQQQQEQVRLLHQEKLEREQQIRTQVSVPQTPPGTDTHGVGLVMDLAPPVGSDVPARLSPLVI